MILWLPHDAGVAGANGISMKTSTALLAHALGLRPVEEAVMPRCIRQPVFLAGVDPGVSQDAYGASRATFRMVFDELKGAIVSNWSSVQQRRCEATR